MPPKRPSALSDAALGNKGGVGSSFFFAEGNAGALPVKNTFIDVPSGFSPRDSPGQKRIQPLATAPAQVADGQGTTVTDKSEEQTLWQGST
ncbi:unnamed protein product [Polarella glacialis]|uniref:Uncharacterized protein n=1 Tax=Polarella glacialis TaxID=89957 RepID=A0A813JKM2_POLGL|nr:unnamed protein product [Polarella glacialis]